MAWVPLTDQPLRCVMKRRMTKPDWRAITIALDPYRPLDFGELQRLYVSPPYSPADRISRDFRAWHRQSLGTTQTAPPPKFLFCGARGSGKSTQLRYLWTRMTSDAEVLLMDVATVLPERASTVQLVAHIGLGLLARLGQWEGADGGVARVLATEEASGFRDVLGEFVPDLDLAALVEGITPLLLAAEIAGQGALSATVSAAKAGRTGWLALQKRIDPVQRMARAEKLMRRLGGDELAPAEALVQQVSRLAEALHGRASKPVVILLDGLDKTLKLDDLLVAFEDIDLLRGLEASLVLAGPTNLRHDVRFAGMRQDLTPLVHNNFPVVTAEGAEREEGIDALVRIASARLENMNVFDPAALRRAARWSSGMPREFLRLLRDAALRAEDAAAARVGLADVEAVGKELRLTLQQPLTLTDLRLLDQVRIGRRVGDSPREQDLLFENFIACYPNDNAYFRPHEILVEWVASEAARLDATGLA